MTTAPAHRCGCPRGFTELRADGEEFAAEATLSRGELTGAPLFTVILRDVDERRRAEAERRRLETLTQYLQDEAREAARPNEPIGTSPALARVLKRVEQVAPTDSTVLLTGETGTGKEMIARAIHARSRRRDAVLVKVNCAAIPDRAQALMAGRARRRVAGLEIRKRRTPLRASSARTARRRARPSRADQPRSGRGCRGPPRSGAT